MMNKPRISPGRLIQAIKQEDLRCKARSEDLIPSETVAKANAPPADQRQGANQYFCSYCKKNGHSLEWCNEVAKILANNPPGEKAESSG
jgi:hypothetical protein